MSRPTRWIPLVAAAALVVAPIALACEGSAAMAPACPMGTAMAGGECHSGAAEAMDCCAAGPETESAASLSESPRLLRSPAQSTLAAPALAASPLARVARQPARLHDPPLYYRVSSLLL